MNVQTILKQQAAQQQAVSKARAETRRLVTRDDHLTYMDVRALVAALPFVPFAQTEQVARAVYAAEVRS